MAQPVVEPCSRGVIEAQPCPRALGREIPAAQRRWVLAACVLASSMAFIDRSALTVSAKGHLLHGTLDTLADDVLAIGERDDGSLERIPLHLFSYSLTALGPAPIITLID